MGRAGFEFCLGHFESEFCGAMVNKRLKTLEIRAEVKPLRNTDSKPKWDEENLRGFYSGHVQGGPGAGKGMPSGETQEEGRSLVRTQNVAEPGKMPVF